MPQDGRLSEGPHSATGWVNMLGVPAIVVPGGFYPGGLPFGLEISTRPWHDGDLIGWAYDYEQRHIIESRRSWSIAVCCPTPPSRRSHRVPLTFR